MNKYFELLMDYKFKEAEKFREEKIPKRLYKFYFLNEDAGENNKRFETLQKNCLWMSPANKMNDPYEYKCMYLDEKTLKQYGYPQEFIDAYNRIFESMIKKVYLTSFTENNESFLPMWAYYSNNYRGYCVEYEVLDPKHIYKVSYEPQRIPIAKIAADIYCGISDFLNGNANEDKLKFNNMLLMQQVFLKHKSWEHEKEYRIVAPIDNPPLNGCQVDVNILGLKVRRIYAGINSSDTSIERLNNISNSLGCGVVVRLKVSDQEYAFEENPA